MATYIKHHGVKGQQWGVRRFQNEDGTRTAAGLKQEKAERKAEAKVAKAQRKTEKQETKNIKKQEKYQKRAQIKTSTILATTLGGIGVSLVGVGVKASGKKMAGKFIDTIGAGMTVAGLVQMGLRGHSRSQLKKQAGGK